MATLLMARTPARNRTRDQLFIAILQGGYLEAVHRAPQSLEVYYTESLLV
jgi:hypothetical protein